MEKMNRNLLGFAQITVSKNSQIKQQNTCNITNADIGVAACIEGVQFCSTYLNSSKYSTTELLQKQLNQY